jgi:hypothetical protein
MAKEEKKPEGEKREGAKPKHKMKGIMIHVTGTKGHHVLEHHMEDHRGHPLPPHYAGVATNLADLHQHLDDHLEDGGEAGGAPEEEGAPQGGAPEEAAPQGAQPAE